MATIDQRPARLDMYCAEGDDFTATFSVTENGSPWVSTGATVVTGILNRAGTAQVTNFTTAVSTGSLTLTLTDTQTTTLGAGVYRYYVQVTKSGVSRTWVAGGFTVAPDSGTGTSSSTASLSITTDTVTLDLTTLVAPTAANISVTDAGGYYTGTTVEAVLAEIGVRFFAVPNATGTAATDTANIQAALTAANTAGGGEVVLGTGTYLINASLLVPSKCIFRGHGMSASTIKLAPGNYSAQAKSSIMLNWNYASAAVDEVAVDQYIVVRDMTIDGNRANITPGTESEGIDWVNVDYFDIRNVEILNVHSDGIDLDRCAYGTVDSCVIKNCYWNGFHAGWASGAANRYVNVTNCYVEGCAQGRVGFDAFYGGIHNDSFRGKTIGNHVVDCYRGIVVTYQGSVGGAVVMGNTVSGSKTGYDITVSESYAHVEGNFCVSTTGNGSTGNVEVATGGQGVTIVGNTLSHDSKHIDVNCANGCTITGNVMRGAASSRAVYVQGGAHTVSGNSIGSRPSSSARGAIEVASTASGSSVTNNRIIATTAAGRAVLVAGDNCIIEGNTMTGTPAAFIEITGDNCVVLANRGTGATAQGLLISAAADATHYANNHFGGCTAAVTDNGTNTYTDVPAGGSSGQALLKTSSTDFATTWTSVTTLAQHNSGDFLLPSGALAGTMSRLDCSGSVASLSTGRQSFTAIYLPAGTYNTITVWSGSTAAGSPTNQWFSIYDSSRNKVAVTNDDTTTAWAGNTAKTLTISGGVTVTAGLYYIGVMVAATTVPTLVGPALATSGFVGATPVIFGFDATNTGLTTPASSPATAAAFTAAASGAFFAYVS